MLYYSSHTVFQKTLTDARFTCLLAPWIILSATNTAQSFEWETVGHSSDSLERLISSAIAHAEAIWGHFTCHSALRESSLII